MKKVISNAIILVGIILILGSLFYKTHAKFLENKAIRNFEQKLEKNHSNYEINIGEEIALIEIPSIKLNTVIVHGVNDKLLNSYVCHFENTAMPGEYGNFAIAGHSSYVYSQVLDDLHKVNVNDEINIRTISQQLIYVITDVFITAPESIEVLNQNNDIKEITIITCSNRGANRLIIKGVLKEI